MKTRSLSVLFLALISVTGATAQNGWMKYPMYDGKFSFSLPCLPEIKTQDVSNAGGKSVLKTYSCSSENVRYTAAYTDFPNGINTKLTLDGVRDDFAKGFGGRITAEKMITVFSHQGRDIWARAVHKDYEGIAVYRFVLVGKRLYALGIVKRADTPVPLQNEKFFSTFALEG